MGLAKANEILLWGKKKDAQELLECGFIKYVYSQLRKKPVSMMLINEQQNLSCTTRRGVSRECPSAYIF